MESIANTAIYAARTPNPTDATTVKQRIMGIINEITTDHL
jgi:hypothetical protein